MNSIKAQTTKGNILIVDDNLDSLSLLSTILREEGYKVRKAINGQMALMGAQAEVPDLILLDIMMPEPDGYQVCQQLKALPLTREIPVIFLSALDEPLDKVKAFKIGGVDYITKPFQCQEVLARIENQMNLQAAKAEIYRLNQDLERLVQQRTAQLEREITEHKRTQEQLRQMAFHDPLTDLPNRALFLERLEQAINRAKRRSDYLFAVLFLDCDRFKVVNDSLGHLRGDQLLIAVARRLESCLRSIDMLARFGGDEFAILLEEIEEGSDATTAAKRLREALSLPFPIDQYTLFFNASIGIVLGTKEYEHPEALLRDADTAMYQAKKLGQAGYQVFDSEMHARARRNLSLETDLKLAMARKDFVLYYQPLLELTTGCLTGFEVLLRWIHPEQGLISPVEFIPLAEETGLIVPMGMWVLREACHQLQTWQNQGLAQSPVKLSVNLSAKQFLQPDLVEQIDRILAETQLDSGSLKLEITESAFADNDRWARESLQRLRNRQIQLLIDDFGTGYSSLSYLHRFPVDGLKIDRSFIRPLSEDGRHLKIVQALVSLAHHLDLSVTAEGIETTQQLAQLRALGCSEGQGYFLSQPLSPSEAEAFLADEQYKYHTSPTL